MDLYSAHADGDVYQLVTDLSRHLIRTNHVPLENSHVSEHTDGNAVKRLRSRAFEILLNKSGEAHCHPDWTLRTEINATMEILKHAFILKTAFNARKDAASLESLLDELTEDPIQESHVAPILIFLMQLRRFKGQAESLTNIFNSVDISLSNTSYNTRSPNNLEICPSENFFMPSLFAATLEMQRHQIMQSSCTTLNIEPRLPHMFGFASLQSIEFDGESGLVLTQTLAAPSICALSFPNQWSFGSLTPTSNFIPEITMEEEKDARISICDKGLATYSHSNYRHVNEVNVNSSSVLEIFEPTASDKLVEDSDAIWSQPDVMDTLDSKARTWESLGLLECEKEAPFITDLPNTAVHLVRIKETCCFPLLKTKIVESIQLLEEVPAEDFFKDIKSLFLGVESNCFKYTDYTGFELRKHISVYGISPRSMEVVCQDPILWGNCYKFLTTLVRVEPQTGKLIREGLIFKAMCTSLQELLLYYRASLLRLIAPHKQLEGLLSLLAKVRPVAKLVIETARLCGYDGFHQSTIIEGNDILHHIYQEVVKVTDTKVAMVFYSILKSCCEVYFRFLQKWMFEGLCDDVYGEFMIKADPQFLRHRGHKFWTKSFSITNNDAVPGFLKDLTNSILQCGKTVRLLRICDIKNPVCNICVTEQPDVKVCLSVAMLRDQSIRCREYDEKGKAALGPVLSLSSAIEERKRIEKETAQLVINAQQTTVVKLNEEREEALRDIARNKRDLLASLKDQVAEVNLRKKKEKEDEIREYYTLVEQQTAQRALETERQNITRHYNTLLLDVEKRQMRAEWRAKRMSFYEKRIAAIRNGKDLLKTKSETPVEVPENLEASKDTTCTSAPVEVPENVEASKAATCTSTRLQVRTDPLKTDSETPAEVPENVEARKVTTSEDTQVRNVNDSYEDENKNIMPIERPVDDTTATTLSQATVKSQESTEKIANIPMSYLRTNRKHNETSSLQNFLREEALKEIGNKMFVKNLERKTEKIDNTEIPYTELINALKTSDNDNQRSIERPTYLSFTKLDNMPGSLTTGFPDNVLPRKYDMTPNNNELRINCTNEETISLAPHEQDRNSNNVRNLNINEADLIFKGSKTFAGSSRTIDVETPMSCTTDRFTSSTQSPISQIEVASLQTSSLFTIDIDSNDTPISSQPLQTPISLIHQQTSPNGSRTGIPQYCHFASNHREWFAKPVKSNTTPSLTLADVESIDHTSLQIYLKKSILIPLQVQSRLVNNAIIKFFLKEHNLLAHFHSLRSYFFLLNGEFAKNLTDSLYTQLYQISIPIELFNSTTLTNVLERALLNSFSNVYANSELLSLSASDTPEQLQISDPSALDCLCLNYKISWPLNIILDDIIMAQYRKVFKFLITSGRVSWVLQEDFNIMKRERNAAYSQQYHKLQLYRHAMTEFMNALHNYLTCSVLQCSWAELEKELQQASTLDQIYISHIKYIKKILSRCMLNVQGEKMRVWLNNIFKVILKFHNRLGSQSWIRHKSGAYVHPNFKKLEELYGAFCEFRSYMAYLAYKLAASGYQPHLMHFLNALNINHFYDLTVKPERSGTTK